MLSWSYGQRVHRRRGCAGSSASPRPERSTTTSRFVCRLRDARPASPTPSWSTAPSPSTSAVDHMHAAMPRPVGQRTAQGGGLHLLRRPLLVVARRRAVHDATAGVLRRADRALPGPAGALLPVGLPAATATSPRVLVLCVPWRAAASWATTTWWISGMLAWTSKTSAGSSAVPAWRRSVRTSTVRLPDARRLQPPALPLGHPQVPSRRRPSGRPWRRCGRARPRREVRGRRP